MTLAWILVASVAGGTLSAGLAALALTLRATWIPMLVSFAIGALLGAAFLEIIPHAFEEGEAHQVAFSILGGIFGFFVLEKLLLYRHCHTEHCEVHDAHDHGRSGTLIVVGDSVHNFVDGVLIAAAFLQSTELGVVAAVAIIAHEIPQEVGDFLILLHSGYSRARDRKSTRLNSSHSQISYAVFCLKAPPTTEIYPLSLHDALPICGTLIVVGDSVHNFVDGVLIAAAFLQSTELGVVAAVAIIAHEIPQEVGDFLILLHSGYSRARALAMNLLSSAATVIGGVIGYFGLQLVDGLEPILLGVVAASMIYVAVADLIPGLHRRPELRDTAFQALLIALGIGAIAAVGAVVPH